MGAERSDPRVRRTCNTVLRAAHRLLVEEGFDGVTFARISRDTGVSRTTLYRHWNSPADLVGEAWAAAAPTIQLVETADVRSDLVGIFGDLRDMVESAPMRRVLPSVIEAAAGDPDVARMHTTFVADRRRPIVERLKRAVTDGELRADADCELLADLLAGPIFYRRLLRHVATTDDDLGRLVDAALAGAVPVDRPVATHRG